jgi:hypothetical protein
MGLQSVQMIPCERDVCMRHTYCSVFCLSGQHSADAGSSYFVFVAFYCLLFWFGPFHFEGFPHPAIRVYCFTPECTASYRLFPFVLHILYLCLSWTSSHETTVLLELLDCSFFLSVLHHLLFLFLSSFSRSSGVLSLAT